MKRHWLCIIRISQIFQKCGSYCLDISCMGKWNGRKSAALDAEAVACQIIVLLSKRGYSVVNLQAHSWTKSNIFLRNICKRHARISIFCSARRRKAACIHCLWQSVACCSVSPASPRRLLPLLHPWQQNRLLCFSAGMMEKGICVSSVKQCGVKTLRHSYY